MTGSCQLSCAQDYEYLQLEYDPVSNGEYWSRRPVLVVKRALQVRRNADSSGSASMRSHALHYSWCFCAPSISGRLAKS